MQEGEDPDQRENRRTLEQLLALLGAGKVDFVRRWNGEGGDGLVARST